MTLTLLLVAEGRIDLGLMRVIMVPGPASIGLGGRCGRAAGAASPPRLPPELVLPQESGDSPPRLPPELVLPQAPVTPAVTVGFFKKQEMIEMMKKPTGGSGGE